MNAPGRRRGASWVAHVSRRIFAIVVVVILLAGGGAWWWFAGRAVPAVAWQGYGEADFVKIGPTQPGLLTMVSVARGDEVAEGALLFTQDSAADLAARDQAARLLAQAQGQLANLQEGGRRTDISEAEANLADARATQVRAAADLARGQALFPAGATSQQNIDQLEAAYKSAKAKVDALDAMLSRSRAPIGRNREIEAQRAAVAASRAALDMADWRLGQRRIVAPAKGRVADILARPGETMAAGAPVVSLLPPANIFVRFFVPEAAISSLHRGDPVALKCDGCPADLTATVSFISPQAEYTPPVIYSEASKTKMVFLVEARPAPEQAVRLTPGQPIEVRPKGPRTP